MESVMRQNFILEKDKKELLGTIRQRKKQMAIKSNKDAIQSGQGNDDIMGKSSFKRAGFASMKDRNVTIDSQGNLCNIDEEEDELPPQYTYSVNDSYK